jgi:hypothetical protein
MAEGEASMLNRLFPKQVDNTFDGHRAALWLLGLFIALKLVMSVNSILNTASVATGADGLPLDSFGPAAARTVPMLFALMSLGQLTLAVIALTTLIRYRAMVPFIYLVLLGEELAPCFIVQSYAVARTRHRARHSARREGEIGPLSQISGLRQYGSQATGAIVARRTLLSDDPRLIIAKGLHRRMSS